MKHLVSGASLHRNHILKLTFISSASSSRNSFHFLWKLLTSSFLLTSLMVFHCSFPFYIQQELLLGLSSSVCLDWGLHGGLAVTCHSGFGRLYDAIETSLKTYTRMMPECTLVVCKSNRVYRAEGWRVMYLFPQIPGSSRCTIKRALQQSI